MINSKLVAAAIGGLALLGAAGTATATVGDPVRAGDITVVDASDPSVEISGGGSAVAFTFRLPIGTTCPGDSANDQWRVHAFLVPVGDDPTTLQYGPNGPEGPGQWALYGVDTNPLVDELLARNPAPGSPGLILPIRPLTFAVYTGDILEPGRYRMGLACTFFRDTAIYWDTEVEITEDPADEPAHRIWRVLGSTAEPAGSGGGSRSTVPLVVGAGLVVVAAVLVWVSRRRRHSDLSTPPPLVKEST